MIRMMIIIMIRVRMMMIIIIVRMMRRWMTKIPMKYLLLSFFFFCFKKQQPFRKSPIQTKPAEVIILMMIPSPCLISSLPTMLVSSGGVQCSSKRAKLHKSKQMSPQILRNSHKNYPQKTHNPKTDVHDNTDEENFTIHQIVTTTFHRK